MTAKSRTYVILILVSFCVFPSCDHLGASFHSRRQTEDQLVLLLTEVFEQENAAARAIDVKKLKGHAWNLENMQRDVMRLRHESLIYPWLDRLRIQARSDAVFIQSVKRIAQQSGCSKALTAAVECTCSHYPTLRLRTHEVFGFMNVFDKELDPNYRYSQQIIDERIMFAPRFWED